VDVVTIYVKGDVTFDALDGWVVEGRKGVWCVGAELALEVWFEELELGLGVGDFLEAYGVDGVVDGVVDDG
jgi:hypothetical protein